MSKTLRRQSGRQEAEKEVVFSVRREDPRSGVPPRFQVYSVPITRGMTVLDALRYIKEKLDHSLSLRFSCRMGVCGSCGMIINGLPRLACETQVLDLKTDRVEVKPSFNFPVIRDLATDFDDFFDKHVAVRSFIIRDDAEELEAPSAEYYQTENELEDYLQFSYCIRCGLCYSACPTVATDLEFLGPQSLAQAARYSIDTRDEGLHQRLALIDEPHGVWRCHLASACSTVCPKGVDPAFAIQLLKRAIIRDRLGLKAEKKGAPTLPRPPAD